MPIQVTTEITAMSTTDDGIQVSSFTSACQNKEALRPSTIRLALCNGDEDNVDRVVTMEEYHKLLEACPSQEWRTIIALARIGGLRPCEIRVLRWSDIGIGKNKNRFSVFSPKLNPHEYLRKREVPLFPLLLTELDKLRLGNEDEELRSNLRP